MSKPTTHTAATYQAKYLKGDGGNASLSRLLRYARMVRRENLEAKK